MVAGAGITDVVFDFCGVLVDRRVTQTLAGLYPSDQITEYFAYDDRSGFHYYEDLLDRGTSITEVLRQCSDERGREAARMLQCYYEHADRGLTHLVPGIEGLLADLHRAGIRIWGLTNMASRTFHRMYCRFPQLRQRLSGVLVSADVNAAKPDPCIFELAARRFELNPVHTLFVDDSSINVEAAERTGMQGTTFIDVPHLREALRARHVDIPAALAETRTREEHLMFTDHDGASACTSAAPVSQDTVLTPNNQGMRGAWCSLPLGSITLPPVDESFWAERCREYRALQWQLIDWGFVRDQLQLIARQLGPARYQAPEIVLPGKTTRERTFLEQWFGYGDAPCTVQLKGGQLKAVSGQHRMRAVANAPLSATDAELLGLSGQAFFDGAALADDAELPVFVRE